MNHFHVLFSHNSSSLLDFNDLEACRLTEQRLKGKNKSVNLYKILLNLLEKDGLDIQMVQIKSRSRELADLLSSRESSSTCQSEQCNQVYIGWLGGTI